MGNLAAVVAKRMVFGFLTLIVVSVLIFLGTHALPGDIAEAILGQEATPETVAAFRRELKLDLPAHVRYGQWLWDFLQGDLGNSLATGRPISEVIGSRFTNTLFLAGTTALIVVPLSVILGMLAALYRNSWFDRIVSMVTLGSISFPEYLCAYILIALFSVQFHIFPSMSNLNIGMSFSQKVYVITLPCLTLMVGVLAHMMRMTRAAIINVLSNPYIEMAQLKGLRQRRIIFYHAFPNALSPIINVIVMNIAYLVVGVVIVEVVFVYPGLGQLMVDSVSKRDIPVIQTCGLIFASTYILLNMAADILAIISNPKLMHPKSGKVFR
jgi:peptide/nickel transport system permease protein